MAEHIDIGEHEKQVLRSLALESIKARLEHRHPDYDEPTDALQAVRGAFVTLRKNGRLRGCIGTLNATDRLAETIKEMARSSAFHDPRFPPLAEDEIHDIEIEISVLTPLQKIASVEEIEVGKHGLYVTRGSLSGVLLPQVPVEQGWDRDTFLDNTCRKAGLPQDAWKHGDVDLYTFSAVVF